MEVAITAIMGRNMHNGHPIFNIKTDLDDPKFELGICFTGTVTFIQVIRNHSIKHGRDIIYTINYKYKVQVKYKHKTSPWLIYDFKAHNEDTI